MCDSARSNNVVLFGAQNFEHICHTARGIRSTFYKVIGITRLGDASIVHRVQPCDLTTQLEQVNERQEVDALQTIFVQIIGMPIAGSQNNNAVSEEVGEEPLKYHRVRNISHLELIEADKPRFPGNHISNRFRWIEGSWLLRVKGSILRTLTFLCFVNLPMDIGHEGIEVNTSLALDLIGVKEKN